MFREGQPAYPTAGSSETRKGRFWHSVSSCKNVVIPAQAGNQTFKGLPREIRDVGWHSPKICDLSVPVCDGKPKCKAQQTDSEDSLCSVPTKK
jgi:hypothetical protein